LTDETEKREPETAVPEAVTPVGEPAREADPGTDDPADVQATPAPDSGPARKDKPDATKEPVRPRHPSLIRAYRSGRPVEGTITKVIKGGYEVKIGRARGFCPHSQVDLHREDDPDSQIGKSYLFRIMQIRRGGEDVVLSRRAMLEADRADEAKAVRATLIEGSVMLGRVAGTAPFGAFVDLGAGVLGLSHISELSHNRVRTVEEAVKVGDSVRVKILKLNEKSGKISLSIRQAEKDPWADVANRFRVGQVYPGTVTRIADFGAFVELEPGLEALAPASEFPPAENGWNAGLEVGSSRDWCVLSTDAKGRRASVTLPGDATLPLPPLEVESEHAGTVQRVENYGVFVWLGPGRVGLMPRVMTGAPEGADLGRLFKIGAGVEVRVVEITEGGRRIRLIKKGVSGKPERRARPEPRRAERAERAERPKVEEPAEPFGTSLADKLRAALGQKEDS
jgi:small subunit ribosomal protein S1